VNVTCNKCSKRYVIADEKLVGKASVKIRCKQCQNLITVAGLAAGGQEEASLSSASSGVMSAPSGVMAAAAPPEPDPASAWYAMVGGKQVGPLEPREFERKTQSGEISLRTYVWKPGMGDWKRASDVPELASLFSSTSAGATATGPVQAAAPSRPQRDVALANESPAPAAQARDERAPLNDLFNDVAHHDEPALGDPAAATGALAGSGLSGEHATGGTSGAHPSDPFAALGEPSEKELPPPGEATKFFIAQAGVNKRNPPWKIALFVAMGIGLPTLGLFLLSTLHVVELPLVTRTTEDGQEVQESFFSPGGVSGLKDILTGDASRKKAEAERKRLEREAAIASAHRPAANQGTGTGKVDPTPDEPVVPPKPSDPSIAALYLNDDRKQVGPRVRPEDRDNGTPQVSTAGLKPEVISKVVADKQRAFQLCIDNALHRNPNLAVGSITVVLTVGPSGAVKAANIDPKKHEGSDWAQCMMSAGKRIVFPSSDGETEVQLPFKLGVAMSP
jgi:predicted Zn finger-like uncharacterized protein